MSRRRTSRWVEHIDDQPAPLPLVPWWFATPMPEPWDLYLWHQWPSAWAELTLEVCGKVWSKQGARLYAAQRDTMLRDDLKSWLVVRAIETAADFTPDPWHPRPESQWGAFLRGSLTIQARHHFQEAVGHGSLRAGREAIRIHRQGIDSLEWLDEQEADTGRVTGRHHLHGHNIEASDPLIVLIRLEEFAAEVDRVERRYHGRKDGTYTTTTSQWCLITGCTNPVFSKGLCRADYTRERRRLAPNCTVDECLKPQDSRGMCQYHARKHKEQEQP